MLRILNYETLSLEGQGNFVPIEIDDGGQLESIIDTFRDHPKRFQVNVANATGFYRYPRMGTCHNKIISKRKISNAIGSGDIWVQYNGMQTSLKELMKTEETRRNNKNKINFKLIGGVRKGTVYVNIKYEERKEINYVRCTIHELNYLYLLFQLNALPDIQKWIKNNNMRYDQTLNEQMTNGTASKIRKRKKRRIIFG